MLVLGYCSHGDSLPVNPRVRPWLWDVCGSFLSLKHDTAEANTPLCYRFFLFVIDVKRAAALKKRGCAESYIMCSMSRRGNFPHGGVFQGLEGSCRARAVMSGKFRHSLYHVLHVECLFLCVCCVCVFFPLKCRSLDHISYWGKHHNVSLDHCMNYFRVLFVAHFIQWNWFKIMSEWTRSHKQSLYGENVQHDNVMWINIIYY